MYARPKFKTARQKFSLPQTAPPQPAALENVATQTSTICVSPRSTANPRAVGTVHSLP